MFRLFVRSLANLFRSRAALLAENVALRRQVALVKGRLGQRRVRLSWQDRMFRVGLSKVWSGWRTALIVVRPETVLRWHRRGFRAYWRWRSRPKAGRSPIGAETRELIARMHRENPLYVELPAFTANCECSASTSPNQRYRSISGKRLGPRRRLGAPSFATICTSRSRLTVALPCVCGCPPKRDRFKLILWTRAWCDGGHTAARRA